jgi:SAM-dependent methyltransferase
MGSEVARAYACRVGEYIEHVGSMAAVHPSDLQLVTGWADRLDGPLIDAGCGPGHWTGHLYGQGVDVHGVDQVPEFLEHARRNHPDVPFTLGSLDALPDRAGSIAGVLAWYSLIHHEPAALRTALAGFARVLRPGGELLLGYFHGAAVDTFEHAVIRAYRWPSDVLSEELRAVGFEVAETHIRTGHGYRPHGAIVARVPAATNPGGRVNEGEGSAE